jgi:hypothetical protein
MGQLCPFRFTGSARRVHDYSLYLLLPFVQVSKVCGMEDTKRPNVSMSGIVEASVSLGVISKKSSQDEVLLKAEYPI